MKVNDKKLKIIQAGFRLLNSKGYNGTGLNEIIAATGIPKGSFYHYFENKLTFTAEVINYYADQVALSINQKLDDESLPPLKRLKDLYQSYVDRFVDTQSFPYGGFASKISHELGPDIPLIQQATNNVFQIIKESQIKCLKQAVEQKQLPEETNVEKLAELIIFAWEGAIVRMKGSSKLEPLLSFIEILNTIILKENE